MCQIIQNNSKTLYESAKKDLQHLIRKKGNRGPLLEPVFGGRALHHGARPGTAQKNDMKLPTCGPTTRGDRHWGQDLKEQRWRGDCPDLRIAFLLFADDVVLLASTDCGLQHALRLFAAECEVVRMRVSTFKSGAMVLCREMVDCSLRVASELLPQAK
ncbi:hypothetical protein N1851_025924 [Merluccius polli]|uniref:Reverse transcriptase domain-containing protein n=1 Tax=Merluccius polli TaxID=89951 RepID=A0AA47MCS5_MERPO|nr:hypothetical protein N1851_025924 [Merluccius polli]